MSQPEVSTDDVLDLLSKLLCESRPKVTDELQHACDQLPELKNIVEIIVDLRIVTTALRKGELDEEIKANNYVSANLKALQANLHHLVWQLTQVSKGDYSQRIDYLGDFSDSFNAMCELLEKRNLNLKELAQMDALTGLANRQYLDEYLDPFFANAVSSKERFSAMMIDIDFFKEVNDTYGHDVGDLVLEQTGKYLKQVFRGTDFIARYGGEEFLAILPNTSLEQATLTANRVLEYFNNHPVDIREDFSITVTVSIGVSEALDTDTSPEQVVKRSDTALYRAKHNGRNRVEVV